MFSAKVFFVVNLRHSLGLLDDKYLESVPIKSKPVKAWLRISVGGDSDLARQARQKFIWFSLSCK